MGELTPALVDFLDANRVGVLATTAESGRPRQSLVYYARDGDSIFISTLAERRKAKDAERAGWASICVMGHEPPFPSATLSGPAEILTEGIGPPTAAVMQRITGAADPPPPLTDEALAEVGRVVMRITVDRVAAVNYVSEQG